MTEATDRDKGLWNLVFPVLIAAAVLTALTPFVLGVAVDGVLAAANLAAIGFVVRGVLRGALLSWGSLAALKFAVLLFVAWIVLKNHWAGAVALALGYAALPLGIAAGQLVRGGAARPESEG